MRFSPILAASAVVALTVAGCGRTPISADVPATTKPDAQKQQPANPRAPFQQPGQGAGQQNVQQLLQEVSAAFNAMPGYRADLETTDSKGSQKALVKSKVVFSKPEVLKFEIKSNSDQPSQAGTKALWRGGQTIDVRPSGLLGFAKVTLQTSDNRVKTLNGYTIDQINVKAAMNSLLSPKAQIKILGNSNLGPRQMVLLDVSGATMASDIDHQRIGIDSQTKLPILIDMLKGEESKYAVRLLNMAVTKPNSSELSI
jgi:outer membrane lipoprotein-sorting protein